MKLRTHFLLLLTVFISCTGSTENDLKDLLSNNKSDFELVNNRFLSIKALRWINISKTLDSSKCESINKWSNCSEGWETWDDKIKKKIYLKTKEEVLKTENITLEEYNYFLRFLKNNNLNTIAKGYGCVDCVDLESSLAGLRYTRDKNYSLEEDFEYLSVEKINDNWFVYTRDWN